MKRNLLKITALLILLISMVSCELITTPKFDGTYKCTTVSDSSTSELKLALTKFDIKIEMQKMEVIIDGMRYTGDYKVDNDGNFNISLNINLLLTEVDVTFKGMVTEAGKISGTISEKQKVLIITAPTRTGTFSGTKS